MPTGISTGEAKRGSGFRSGLLIGASVLAIVAMAPQAYAQSAPPADAPKWRPNVSVGGAVGSAGSSGLQVTGFDPVWQDLNSMVYVRLGVGTPGHKGLTGNFGVGYRTKLDGDWIAGVFGGFDLTGSKYDHDFSQASIGAEAMSADWDIRANGYFSLGSKPQNVANSYQLYIHDTRIAILQGQEWAYSGFDGEVGYRIWGKDDIDVRVYAGGFSFTRDSSAMTAGGHTFDLGPGSIAGPMGRAEVQLYDLDTFGQKSRLTFTGEISHDDVRGNTGYFGVSLKVPLGAGPGETEMDELDRRMVDPVRRRDGVLTEFGYTKPEPVIIYNGTITSEPTNTLYYVDNSAGAGSYADPTTFHDATARGPHNQFVVLTDKEGPVVASGVVVQSGESVVGPGTFSVRGVDSHKVFTHDFAPGSGPVTVNTADGITLDSDTNLFGFAIDSTAPNAIYGHNVNDVVIGNLTIDGGGVGGNGIFIAQDSGTGSVKIYSTTITDVGIDGILGEVSGTAAGTVGLTLDLHDVSVDGAGHDGIEVVSTSTGGATVNTSLGIHDSTVTGSGDVNVLMVGTVFAGSTLNQNLVVDPTTVTGGLYGIVAGGTADGGTFNQTVDIDHVTATGATYADIFVYGEAINGGAFTQDVTLNHVTVDGSYNPIFISAVALDGGTVDQTVSLTHITATGGYYDNITFNAYAAYSGTVHQTITGSDITTTGSVFGDGLFARADAYEYGTAIQTITIDGLTSTGNYFDGVGLSASADNYDAGDSAVAAQYVTLTNATITGNGFDGVNAAVSGFDDSVARQDLTISDSTITGNYFDGVYASSFAGFFGASQQYVNLIDDTVDGNGLDGASFDASAFALGSAQQTVYIEGGSFSDNGGDGIRVSAESFFAGQVTQNAGIYDVTATGNAGDGLSISTNAYGYALGYSAYYSHVGQNVITAFDDFSHNAGNGVHIENYAGYGAQVNQFVYLYDVHADHNGASGVYEHSVAESYGYYGGAITTNLYADLYVFASTANNNAIDGLTIKGTAFGPTYLIQHIQVGGTEAEGNVRSGLVDYAQAYGFYSLNIQYVTVGGSTFNGNGQDGAAFLATQSYGPLSFGAAIQDVSITASDFSGNGHDGLYAFADASDVQGRAEQHFTIGGSYFDGNGVDGASFTAFAHDGVYVPGYDCGLVQGLDGGCAFVRETIQIVGSEFDNNGGNGISVYNHATNYGAVYGTGGRPIAPTLIVAYSDVSGNGTDGLHVENSADGNSYIYNYFVGIGSHFDNNQHNGVEINSDAGTGSLVLQGTILYGIPGYSSSASGNVLGDGVSVTSTATGGTVQQLVGIYGSDLSYNGDSGVKIAGKAYEPTVAGSAGYVVDPTVSVTSQYITALGNTFYGNGIGAPPGAYEGGLLAGAFAYGPHSVAQQYERAIGNTFAFNYGGLMMGGFAFDGGATNQYLDSEHNLFVYNAVGEAVLGRAHNTGFVNQSMYSYDNAFVGNGGGILLLARGDTAGNIAQTFTLYKDTLSNNVYNGISVRTGADGYAFGSSYIYYTHISQNVLAYDITSTGNGGDGVFVRNDTSYGGTLNQFLYFAGLHADGNGGAGFYETSTLVPTRGNNFAFSTNLTSDVYLVGGSFDGNGGNGIDLRSDAQGPLYLPAFFGGYSYLIQHVQVAGVTADGNSGSGLSLQANESGAYSLNAQYVTITGSEFDHNSGSGAAFGSGSYFGPGGFGDTFEQITISGSDFSHNGGYGLDLEAVAAGRQGRAEQHATINGSTFDYNGSDGVHIYASATDGVYIAGHPCDTVQGLAGGCAFVRQNVTIEYSDISANRGNGVSVGTYADTYGAIYGASGRPHAPTLELYGVNVDANYGRGLDISNHVTNGSYLYQYAALIDSTFDRNNSDGIYAASYVGGGSTMLERNLLYSYHTTASASFNAGNGFKSSIEALGGSYARDVNIVQGADLKHDGSFGFDGAVAYADGTSTGLQINAIYFNTINGNGDGIGLYSIGTGAQQVSYIGGNNVLGNAFVGVYGEANFGAFQYIGVYSFGNTVNSNGTDYLFNSFGGSTQILN